MYIDKRYVINKERKPLFFFGILFVIHTFSGSGGDTSPRKWLHVCEAMSKNRTETFVSAPYMFTRILLLLLSSCDN